MKKAFLMGVGALLVFTMNTDALAQSKTGTPVEAEQSRNFIGFEGEVELISGRPYGGHRGGHFRSHRHKGHRGGHFQSHRPKRHFGQGYNRRHFGGLHLYKYYRPYYRPFGNYYSGGYSYQGPKYYRKNHHDRHYRGYEYGPYVYPGY